jgi:hypothetical protein
MSTQETMLAYGSAVTASVSVALGMNQVVKRSAFLSAGTRLLLQRLVPFVAVASAGSLNVFLMRRKELS